MSWYDVRGSICNLQDVLGSRAQHSKHDTFPRTSVKKMILVLGFTPLSARLLMTFPLDSMWPCHITLSHSAETAARGKGCFWTLRWSWALFAQSDLPMILQYFWLKSMSRDCSWLGETWQVCRNSEKPKRPTQTRISESVKRHLMPSRHTWRILVWYVARQSGEWSWTQWKRLWLSILRPIIPTFHAPSKAFSILWVYFCTTNRSSKSGNCEPLFSKPTKKSRLCGIRKGACRRAIMRRTPDMQSFNGLLKIKSSSWTNSARASSFFNRRTKKWVASSRIWSRGHAHAARVPSGLDRRLVEPSATRSGWKSVAHLVGPNVGLFLSEAPFKMSLH